MKTISYLVMTAMLSLGLTQTAFSQKSINLFSKHSIKEIYEADSIQMEFNANRKNDVNVKAVRDFIKSYNNIDNVKWYAIDDGFIAKFAKDGIETKVEYNAAGNRRYVVRSYNESHMPFEVRDIVKRSYYDYNILITYEIENSKGITYIIKIADKTRIKMLKVADDEMNVMEEYVKG